MTETNYWIPIEECWRKKHLEKLQPHIDCTGKAHKWIAKVATHSDIAKPSTNDELNVSRLLLRRLGEELRGVEVLAIGGHGFQAATAACNLFEQSHYLTYVGISDENAKKFKDWTDVKKSITTVKNLVNTSGSARGWQQSKCDNEYEKYSFLCGFKHNNPVFQRILKLPTDPDLYMSQYALAESIWSCASAIGLFAVQFIEIQHVNDLLGELTPIMDEANSLFPRLSPQ